MKDVGKKGIKKHLKYPVCLISEKWYHMYTNASAGMFNLPTVIWVQMNVKIQHKFSQYI